MRFPSESRNDPLLRFSTGDPDEFVERMSGIAPGLSCHPPRPGKMSAEICGAKLPDLGIFSSALANFRVQSERRSFYGVTIFLSGQGAFLGSAGFEQYHPEKAHLMHPEKPFDARMDTPIESLQLCFDHRMLEALAARLQGPDHRDVSPMETLDVRRPAIRSFCRHATFIWGEILRGGPILSSPMIARESVDLLGSLLVTAADAGSDNADPHRGRSSPARLRRAEDYLMANLSNPISISAVAAVAGVSARTLSREFRHQHGTTIHGFIRQRRLEAANRTLLAAEPGETNVTEVAFDFGFQQLGRFSADYKQAFGELPSETLKRW